MKQCDKMPLTTWLIIMFRVHTGFEIIYPMYKLGFVSYIPKLGAPNLRPVTLLLDFFKILNKYITFVVYEVMRKTVQGAYTHTPFMFQMGVNPGGRLLSRCESEVDNGT